MKTTQKNVTLVDVLDPEQKTYPIATNGELRLIVPAQRAIILVPQDQLKP